MIYQTGIVRLYKTRTNLYSAGSVQEADKMAANVNEVF